MSYNWCFTLNNYTTEEVSAINALYPEKVKYLMYGFEEGESGTPHIQGYFSLVKSQKLSGCKKLITRANFSAAKGTAEQNKEYCHKQGSEHGEPVEFGSMPSKGQRNDLDAFKEAVKGGMVNTKRLREEFSDVCAKYPRFVDQYVQDNHKVNPVTPYPLRDWQQELNAKLNLDPVDREVIFVVDPIGNKGKTWFAKYYCQLHDNAQLLESGKKADLACVLRQDIRVLFMNCTRKSVEFLPYGFLESIKDGYVFSPKYESLMKTLGPCHVVVMMNESPDMNAMSADRYCLVNL